MSKKEGENVENHDAFIHSLYEITTNRWKLKTYLARFRKKQKFKYE